MAAARAAGFALTWPTLTAPVRGTDLAGSGSDVTPADVGRFMDESPEAPFVIRDDYFANNRVEDEAERDGLKMTFRGWTYSLQDYAKALESASLLIAAMREPRPSGDEPAYRVWNRVPMFLLVRAVKSRAPVD